MKPMIYATALGIALLAGQAMAADLSIEVKKGGGFKPAEITVPAGEKIKLIVKNNDVVPAEFESYELKREEKIEPGATTEIFVGPLDAARYPFFDDNNPAAKGVLIAK